MKSTNTFGIQFIIRVPKNEKSTEAAVYTRITVNGRRSEVSLKKKIDPKFWDEAKGRAKGKRDESAGLNNYIKRIRSIIADGYHNLIQERKPINVDSVKALFTGQDEDAITIKKLFEYHNQEAAYKLAPGTMKNYGTTQRYIGKFLRDKYHRHDILLSELCVSGLRSISKAAIPNRQNTILNIRCSFHPSFSNIPPQEHGTKGLKFKMIII